MYLFDKTFTYQDPLNIAFLCGNQYAQADIREKRNILRSFLEANIPGCRAIILEDNFVFGKSNMQYLSYDSAFLKNLAQVEQLASLYANSIFIIHETISTAAELGMFAINPSLASKICVLTPDDIAIDERKITGFISGAFMGKKASSNRIGAQIIFYPDIEVKRRSSEKSDYYTYFHNNQIGAHLGRQIISFATPTSQLKKVAFARNSYGKSSAAPERVNYEIDPEQQKILISIHPDALKIQLLSMFFVGEFRTEYRKVKKISEHVTYIVNQYEKILLNTVSEIEGIDLNGFALECCLKESVCKLRSAVGYYLYMLQAARLIALEQQDETDERRKIRITTEMDQIGTVFPEYIKTRQETAFGRLFK